MKPDTAILLLLPFALGASGETCNTNQPVNELIHTVVQSSTVQTSCTSADMNSVLTTLNIDATTGSSLLEPGKTGFNFAEAIKAYLAGITTETASMNLLFNLDDKIIIQNVFVPEMTLSKLKTFQQTRLPCPNGIELKSGVISAGCMGTGDKSYIDPSELDFMAFKVGSLTVKNWDTLIKLINVDAPTPIPTVAPTPAPTPAPSYVVQFPLCEVVTESSRILNFMGHFPFDQVVTTPLVRMNDEPLIEFLKSNPESVDGAVDLDAIPVPYLVNDNVRVTSAGYYDLKMWSDAKSSSFKFQINADNGGEHVPQFLQCQERLNPRSSNTFEQLLVVLSGNDVYGLNRFSYETLNGGDKEKMFSWPCSTTTATYAAHGELMDSETFLAPQCACGYYEAFYWESPGVPSDFFCQDIDECAYGLDTCDKENTVCQNTEGSYECVCADHYVLVDGQCVSADIDLATTTTITSTSVHFAITSASDILPDKDWKYIYNITDIMDPTFPKGVYGSTNIQVEPSIAEKGISVSNLRPGTQYQISWGVVNATGAREYLYLANSEVPFTTLCTCGSDTDAPILDPDNAVSQRNGNVYLEFQSNSMCASGYSFIREELISGNVSSLPAATQSMFHAQASRNIYHILRDQAAFGNLKIPIPEYMFSGNGCKETPFVLGNAYSDDLSMSKLIVGKQYRYGITPVGANGYEGQTGYVMHKVKWEASVAGFVGTKESVGSLPIEGVAVSWALQDGTDGEVVSSGNSTTDSSGKFDIVLNLDVDFSNSKSYPLHIQYSKTTEINGTQIHHQFLCNSESSNCTKSGQIINLQHLNFGVPVTVADATDVEVKGMVYMAKTDINPDGSNWGGIGCPIMNVDVCLYDMAPGTDGNDAIVCVKTKSDGSYALPGPIGSFVTVKADYTGHTFDFVSENGLTIEGGFLLEPGHIYDSMNFQDISLAPLSVTVAGGLCNADLGDSTLLFQIPGCKWGGYQVKQYNVEGIYNLPPINTIVRLEGIEGRPDISLSPIDIDLTHATNETYATISERIGTSMALTESGNHLGDNLASQDINAIRFQYNGTMVIRPVIQGDLYDHDEPCSALHPPTPVAVDSMHVLPFQTPTNATFFVEQHLNADGSLVCDYVDPSTYITIVNHVGIVPNDPQDQDYLDQLQGKLPSISLSLLQHCDDGCAVSVISDFDESLNRPGKSRVEFPFMTGRPVIDAPFMRYMTLSTSDVNSKPFTSGFVIVGQYNLGEKYSVAMPTYEPLLILRAPPGRQSVAFYENVETTLRIENFDYSEYGGVESASGSDIGAKFEEQVCEGLLVMDCESIFESTIKVGTSISNAKVSLDKLDAYSYSGGFTTTWSYVVGAEDGSGNSGQGRDVFVVPNLNVKYLDTAFINWNQSTCTTSRYDDLTFSISSPENVPTLAFLNEYTIQSVEIPQLQELAVSYERKINQTTNKADIAEYEKQLAATKDAIAGWTDAISLNNKIKSDAKNGGTGLTELSEWFQDMAATNYNSASSISTKGMSVNSGLLSDELESRAQVRPYYKNDIGEADLSSVSAFTFSGGDGSLSFMLSRDKVKSFVSALGGSGDNEETESIQEVSNVNEVVAGPVLLDPQTAVKHRVTASHSHLQTDEDDVQTAIGLTLQDNDYGDIFVVEAFLDPRFGTFVFNTIGGQSMCPHEPNTNSRLIPHLEVVAQPPRTVLEDQVMLFQVELANTGISDGSFVLISDYHNDTHNLLRSNQLPKTFEIGAGESILYTIEIERASGSFEFAPVVLKLLPSCLYEERSWYDDDWDEKFDTEYATATLFNQIDLNQKESIVFARPCPTVNLMGNIGNEHLFSVNSASKGTSIDVVVENPLSSLMTLHNMTLDPNTRLQKVVIQYRAIGDTEWSYGQYMNKGELVDIDLASTGLEDTYGFVSVPWEVSTITDGQYEMRVQSVCDVISGAPAEFNSFTTDTIPGVIDRQGPKLFGFITPRVELPIGEDIEISFNEDLDCASPFKFKVNMQVGQDIFNNQNLLIRCQGSNIFIQFDQTDIDINSLVGLNLDMNVTGVHDINENPFSSKNPIRYQAKIVNDDVIAAAVPSQKPFRKSGLRSGQYAESQSSESVTTEVMFENRLRQVQETILQELRQAISDLKN